MRERSGSPYGGAVTAVSVRRWLDAAPAWAVDVAVAAGVVAVELYAVSIDTEAGARAPDALAYALGVAAGAILLARRRWPLIVLLLSVAISTAFYSLGYAGGALQPALFAALYAAAAGGRRWWSLFVLVTLVGTSLGYRVWIEGEDPFSRGVVVDLAVMVASWALGVAAYHRRRWADEVRERLRRSEADRELEAQRRVAEERLRMARELHDVMAHTIAVITVQAGVAADVLDDSPDAARAALDTIRTASRKASDELRATVGVLRGGERSAAPRGPTPGLDQLTSLVRTASGAGLRVALAVHGPARPLPAAVDLTAYRILQESLTNVVRHAHATHATVSIC